MLTYYGSDVFSTLVDILDQPDTTKCEVYNREM